MSDGGMATVLLLYSADAWPSPLAVFTDEETAAEWAEEELGPRWYGSGTREDPRGERWSVVTVPDRREA